MTAWALVAGIALLVANGCFVAVQFALLADVRHAVTDRSQLDRELAGTQLGITMASLGLGVVTVPALVDLLDALPTVLAVALALAVVVVAHLTVGEFVPKRIAITAPDRVLRALAGVYRAYLFVLGPVIWALHTVARLVARLFGVQPGEGLGTARTADELAQLLADSRTDGVIEQTSHDLLAGALDLGGRTLGSILVPAGDVVSVPRGATVAEAEAVVVDSGVSRLLVRDDAGAVIGFVHAKDLLTVPAEARHRPLPMARIRRIPVLDRGVRLHAVLLAMRRERTHVAAVVDDDQRFVGIATLEDVLESVVGTR